MGLRDLFNKKKEEIPEVSFPAMLGAAADGEFVTMSQIPDEIFSTGVLGSCCGITPNEGCVYAPIDGKISQVTETLHAIGIEVSGIEILIHVGVDTVDMNGDGFSSDVKMGQAVKKGDILLTMDLDKIRAAGHATTVIMAVTNADSFSAVNEVASGLVEHGQDVLQINK